MGWASVDLDDLNEVNDWDSSSDVDVNANLDAHVIGNLSDSLDDEGKLEEAVPGNLSVFSELDALAGIKIVLSDLEGDLSGVGDGVEGVG